MVPVPTYLLGPIQDQVCISLPRCHCELSPVPPPQRHEYRIHRSCRNCSPHVLHPVLHGRLDDVPHIDAALRESPEHQRLKVQLLENDLQLSNSAFGRAKVNQVLLVQIDRVKVSLVTSLTTKSRQKTLWFTYITTIP